MKRATERDEMLQQGSWEFRSLNDIERLWTEVRTVPMRAECRKHYHEEQYAAALYLLLLGRYGVSSYPFRLDEGESQDFTVGWPSGETSGLEVTRATTGPFQQMTELDQEFIRREKEATVKRTGPEPVAVVDWNLPPEDERVRRWYEQVLEAVRRKLIEKLPKFRRAAHHHLLICDDADVSLFPGRERERVFNTVASALKGLEAQFAQSFRTVSLIMSLDVEYDIGGNRRLLVYGDGEAL
jgi:hypothetical protein